MAKKGAKRDGSKSVAIQNYLDANPGTGAQAVKDALAKQGVDVSVGLVNKVKYSKTSGKGGKKKSSGRRGRPKVTGGPSTSDQIRAYMDANPSATRPEIRDALNAQGVGVSTSLVNAVYVKYLAKQGKKVKSARGGRRAGKRSAGRPAAARSAAPRAQATASGDLSAAELINAKGLVDQLGGIEKVRQALSLLEQLQ